MEASTLSLTEWFQYFKWHIKSLFEQKRRGALTISDLIYLMIAIIILANIMPIIRDYTSQGSAQASGIEQVFWDMMPWVIVLGVLWTIIEKARTPRVEE